MVLAVDEAQLAGALRWQVVERLRLFALFSCGWALLHGAALTVISGSPPAWMWMQTIAFAVAAAVTYMVARRPLGVHTLNALGVGIGIWELSLIAQSARIADEVGFFWVTPLVIVAAGVVLLHRAWLVGYLVAGIGCAFALGRLENHAVSTDIVVMGSAAVTSLMLHEVGGGSPCGSRSCASATSSSAPPSSACSPISGRSSPIASRPRPRARACASS